MRRWALPEEAQVSELLDLASAAVNAMSESAADKRADEAAKVLPEAKRIARDAKERAEKRKRRKRDV